MEAELTIELLLWGSVLSIYLYCFLKTNHNLTGINFFELLQDKKKLLKDNYRKSLSIINNIIFFEFFALLLNILIVYLTKLDNESDIVNGDI